MTTKLYCCGCEAEVDAHHTDGQEIYPHRKDLRNKIFCICRTCGNYVGCHQLSLKPLGCIPTPEVRRERQRVHQTLDPIWKSGDMSRTKVYKAMSEKLGKEFHAGDLASLDEIETAVKAANDIAIGSHPFY